MNKKVVRALALVLVFAMCFGASAYAVEPQPDDSISILRSSLYLSSYSAYIWTDGRTIYPMYDVAATGYMDEIGALTIILKESTDGTTWSTVKTFNYSDYNNMLGYNRMIYTSYVSYTGVIGRYYKAYVTVWAGLGGLGDSRQIITPVVQA